LILITESNVKLVWFMSTVQSRPFTLTTVFLHSQVTLQQLPHQTTHHSIQNQ